MNNIREYLCRKADQITAGSLHYLPATSQEWLARRGTYRSRFFEMLGIDHLMKMEERPDLNVRVTGVVDRSAYTIEKLYFEGLPGLYITANLYVPKALSAPAPAVVYVVGHSQRQKVHYQAHPRRWAELGFVTIILDTIEFGELGGTHHGPYAHGQFHWYSRGYTPAGVEAWLAIRAADLLQRRTEVNGEAIGITGISGGGAFSWWAAAADERFKAVAPVCGTDTFAGQVLNRTIDGHCDCMFFNNIYRWDLSDLAGLIAPRPLLICSAVRDVIFTIDSIRRCVGNMRPAYSLFHADDKLKLIETPGPHSYHPDSRRAIFAWFKTYLSGEPTAPDHMPDIDERPEAQEADETLLVFKDGQAPADERTTTVQDWLMPTPQAGDIASAAELESERVRVVGLLREQCFRHLTEDRAPLDFQLVREWQTGTQRLCEFTFTSEKGWRLKMQMQVHKEAPAGPKPALLYFTNAAHVAPMVIHGIGTHLPENLTDLPDNWVRLAMSVRGVGDTSWGNELAWHVRRCAALTGRTLLSMRVLDALAGIELARQLEDVDGSRLALSGRFEMAVVALYAALLDGQIDTLALSEPSASHNGLSASDGTGDALELLNVLQITDLPQVAGLLWPAQLVFMKPLEGDRTIKWRPDAYRYAETLYARLGAPGALRHLESLARLRPAGRGSRVTIITTAP